MTSRSGGPHICFFAPHAFPVLAGQRYGEFVGGAEVQQVLLARGLAERGHRISMICLDYGQEDELDVDGIRVYRTYRPGEGIPVLRFLWPRLTTMWACLKRVDADIYYQRTAGMQTGVVASFCRRYQKKSIFAAAGEPKIRLRRDYRIYEYGLRTVDQIVVQTAAQARHFRENYGRQSLLIPSCYQAPEQRPVSPRDSVVLWVSTIRKLKRPGLFLELARELPSHRFRMVGGPSEGEHALYEAVRASAEQIPNLEFMGFVSYAQIEQHFDAAAVFVNTSETEGFPNTFLQSWARGVPTVSFIDCEARANGVDVNLLVRTPVELRTTVARLMSEETYRQAQGRLCQDYFEHVHAPDRVLNAYEAIFAGLLNS